MNKTVLIAGVIVLIVLLGGGYFFLSQKTVSPTTSPGTSPAQTQPITDQTTNEKKSLKDLMNSKENQECTYSDAEMGGSGTLHIGKGQLRGDFSSVVNGQTLGSHMISDHTNVYFWTDGETRGIKTTFAAVENMDKNVDLKTQSKVDVNKQLDFTCSPLVIDPSKFSVPTDIEFMDMSSLLPSGMSPGGDTNDDTQKAVRCTACDSLTGEAQTQCKTAMGCN